MWGGSLVRVGVIGVGNMGRNHVRVYSEIEEAELIAIADPKEEARSISRRFGCRYYPSYTEMLDKEKLDGVSIAAPTSLHSEIAVECITREVNVLIEKPITDDVEKAGEIVKLAEKKGVVLTVGHVERHNPAVKKLRELLNKDVFGKLTTIIARRVGVFPPQIKDANVYIDLAVHDIDIFNYLFSSLPDRVFSKASRVLSSREDQAVILLEYGDTTCINQVNWITPVKIRNLAITGEKGYAELDFINQELKVYESIISRSYDSFGDFVIKFGTPRIKNVEVEKAEPLKLELLDFIECIDTGKKPVVSGEDGINALKIALIAQKSAELGKIIEVKR